MSFFLRHKILLIVLIIGGLSALSYVLTKNEDTPDWITETVTRGDVRELVSVSGIIEAESNATLTFPVSGIVREVRVREGDTVVQGQTLAMLEQGELIADRQNAYAALIIAKADKDELTNGPRNEERSVTEAQVRDARTTLEQTITEEAQKVTNAYRTLLSSNLEALPTNRDTEAVPPIISGTYTCDTPGMYTISVFRSGSQSGYSYRLSGFEKGTFTVYTESPSPLGTCGLSIQFVSGSSYSSKVWEVTIPNTRSSTYATNYNTYALAKEQEANAVKKAREALDKALREQMLANAIPRREALTRAEATIMQSEAKLKVIDARLNERTLTAPFGGVITNAGLTVGEVSEGKSIALVASDLFELTVRIPEIDITRLAIEQSADVRFDAEPNEITHARVSFISPTATLIDGVAYFEAKLRFDTPPVWFRSGLNADVDIIVAKEESALRIPKRFLVTEGDTRFVLIPEGTVTKRVPVEVSFVGNDGFVGITGGVRENDTVIAP